MFYAESKTNVFTVCCSATGVNTSSDSECTGTISVTFNIYCNRAKQVLWWTDNKNCKTRNDYLFITIFWLYTYSARICLHDAGALLFPSRNFSQLSHNHSLRKAHEARQLLAVSPILRHFPRSCVLRT